MTLLTSTCSAEVEHTGSFAYAHCGCGWRGPGRRAVDRARRDAGEHAGALLA
ncbi:hypothetical protein [Motilibacter aurantiacus]|uniref:hypothetical protein n=1 Tax=Motilibacter aurantiacus TaxID=2714955 RepID=UPI001407498D|nr:hypothetical protein [Motilibacter aurantiacus]NHC47578.1 hypothetical protein [Motilibacter aurantiacus]